MHPGIKCQYYLCSETRELWLPQSWDAVLRQMGKVKCTYEKCDQILIFNYKFLILIWSQCLLQSQNIFRLAQLLGIVFLACQSAQNSIMLSRIHIYYSCLSHNKGKVIWVGKS